MWLIEKNGAIRELIAPMRANQIAKITSDLNMDIITDQNWSALSSLTTLLHQEPITWLHPF